jgi:hypothetical protein
MTERRQPYTTRSLPRTPSPGGTARRLWPGETPAPGFERPTGPGLSPKGTTLSEATIADFCRCFDTWIMSQSETVKLSSGLAFGEEYRKLRETVNK